MVLRRAFTSLRGRSIEEGAPTDVVLHARELTAAREWAAAAVAWRSVVELGSPRSQDPEPWIELARASRMSRDLATAYDVVQQGLSRHPEALGLIVELARVALRGYAASAEDERHEWKARLLVAQDLLTRNRDQGRVSKNALRAAAEIELVGRRWTDAVALWAVIEGRYPDLADEAILKQVTALRAAGNLAAARAVLDRASPAALETVAGEALARAIAANEGVVEANATFSAASERWHAGEPGVLRAELPVAIARRGHPEERVARLVPLLEDLSAFLDAAASDRVDPGPAAGSAAAHGIGDERDTVTVSGFLYSGSGAVFDLLRGYEEFHLPFRDRETGFLKKSGHLATIVETVTGTRTPDPATVADAVLASTVGFGQTGRPLLGWAAGEDAAVDRLVSQLRWLTAVLRTTWATVGHDPDAARPRAAAAVRGLLDAVVADRTPEGHRALLNNAIIGHQLDRLHLLSRSVAVAVLRDPRDQYVSQRLESPFAMTCADFTAMMAERYRTYATLIEDVDLRHRIVTVGFERFVGDADEPAALLDRLGVAVDRRVETMTFDAERSRRNVGIHRSYAGQEEIDRVATALLDPYRALVAEA